MCVLVCGYLVSIGMIWSINLCFVDTLIKHSQIGNPLPRLDINVHIHQLNAPVNINLSLMVKGLNQINLDGKCLGQSAIRLMKVGDVMHVSYINFHALLVLVYVLGRCVVLRNVPYSFIYWLAWQFLGGLMNVNHNVSALRKLIA